MTEHHADGVTLSVREPAWAAFQEMSDRVHNMLVGAAQCRNHLTAALECWDECDQDEQRNMIEDALERLTRVGI